VLYAHKDDLVHVTEIEEDGRLLTTFGELPVFKGNYLVTHSNGTTRIIDKIELEEYVPVERVKEHKFSEEEIAKNYAQDWSSFEEQDYIDTFQENVRNRNKFDN
jgi:hypothetical protein